MRRSKKMLFVVDRYLKNVLFARGRVTLYSLDACKAPARRSFVEALARCFVFGGCVRSSGALKLRCIETLARCFVFGGCV